MNRYIACVVGCLAVVPSAGADTVLLANGHRIENVVAHAAGESVTIRFSYGEMSLPAGMVERVEKAESALARYLERVAALSANRDATAAAWLDLALVARGEGLEDGYRRALLRAAALDPHWPSLATPLRGLDYVFDEPRGQWLPYEDSAPALALAAERAASRRALAVDEARRARSVERERLMESIELALLAKVVEDLTEQETQPQPRPGILLWGPYGAVPVLVTSPAFGSVGGWPATEANRETLRNLSRRQPGSLLPVNPPARVLPRQTRLIAKSPSGD